ncbi:hypothetical protein [Plantactinospora sp. CA-290183]|uniref:hypothetical protein n=1 Tax=Plantactinospora sp. CA-290183 TaxID=3240006 RepID=UPI003D8C6108
MRGLPALLVTLAVGAAVSVAPTPAVAGRGLLELQPGTLSIHAPTRASLGTVIRGSTLERVLGTVEVDDRRFSNPNPWTATVTSTDFRLVGGSPTQVIPRAQVFYWSGPVVVQTGGGTVIPGQLTAAQAVSLSAPRVAMRKTTGSGNNRLVWQPRLRIVVPVATIAGTYTGTITHSVA